MRIQPIPRAAGCTRRQDDVLRGFEATIGARIAVDVGVLRNDPVGAFEPCEKVATRVSAFSLVRYRTNDYSVPTWLMVIARSW
jgi:hypothetical protein